MERPTNNSAVVTALKLSADGFGLTAGIRKSWFCEVRRRTV